MAAFYILNHNNKKV